MLKEVSSASSIPSSVNDIAAAAMNLCPGNHYWLLEVNGVVLSRIESLGLVSGDEVEIADAHLLSHSNKKAVSA